VRIVNWGYWGDVGAVATDFHRARMVRAGLASIQGPEAVAAAWRMLNAPLRQYGYLQAAPSADLEALGIEPRFHLGLAESSVAVEDTDAGWIPGENAAIDDAEMLATDADALDRAIVDALHAQLSRLSLPSPSTAPQTRDAVRIAAGIVDDYRPWFDRSLDELIRHGYLLEADGLLHAGPRAVDTAVDAGPAAARLPHSARNPALPAYVGAMLDAIPQIVTGQASAVDVAFSEPVSTWAADSYFHDPAVAHGSDVVAMIAAAHVARCAGARPGARVRLLEIGAGRGATTRRVVSALRPQENAVGEYLFTDVSAAFIGPDRRAALDLPGYVAYRTFDVERDPQAQGLPAGAFDIVIAANVLHATGDLERTLRHCALLLRRGGILLLQELTGNPLYAHVTYGLFEGWWRFSDPWQRLRGGPAAAPEAWQELLALTGFRNVRFPAPSLHPLWHQVVFAQSEGVLLRPAGAGVGATAAATTADEASAAGGMRAALPASTSVAVAAETEQGGDGQPRMDAILSGLKTVVAGVLGIEESVFDDESQSFAETLLTEYGMDSLSSINLRNALRARYGIEVPTQQLLGEKTSVIAGAIYNQLLMQRLVSRDAPADDTPSETFVF
jgi:SAM-dependent methyltransferase/acyl carrier protein